MKGSSFDGPFKPRIHELLRADSAIPSKVIRERISEDGYEGGKTILDDYAATCDRSSARPRPTSASPTTR